MRLSADDAWLSCPACRTRPHSATISADALSTRLPHAWRPLGDTEAVGPWARDIPTCSACDTRWLILHDPRVDLLEDTAPLPAAVDPLLRESTPLTTALPLLRHELRSPKSDDRRPRHLRPWVHERIDALWLAWVRHTPVRPATLAVGILHLATDPERRPSERAVALTGLHVCIERARRQGERLQGDWLEALAAPCLRASGPAVMDALRTALAEGFADPAVLAPSPAVRARLGTLPRVALEPPPTSTTVTERIRAAFARRWRTDPDA